MVNKNVLSCLLKDGKEVNAVMLVGRLFDAHATVTRNDRSPMRTACYESLELELLRPNLGLLPNVVA